MSGLSTVFQFKTETTKNTRIAPDVRFPILQESMRKNQENIRSQSLRSEAFPRNPSAGPQRPGGQVRFELGNNGIGELLQLCVGALSGTTGSDPYTHTFVPTVGSLASATVQIGKPSVDQSTEAETVRPFDFIGAMVNAWSLQVTPGQVVAMTIDWLANRMVTDETLATVSPAAQTLFTSQHVTLTLNSTDYCIDTLALDMRNNLVADNRMCSTNPGSQTVRESQMRDYGGTFQIDYDTNALYDDFVAATERTLTVAMNAGSSAQLTISGDVSLDDNTPTVAGAGNVKQAIPFKFNSGGSDELDVVLINTDATP